MFFGVRVCVRVFVWHWQVMKHLVNDSGEGSGQLHSREQDVVVHEAVCAAHFGVVCRVSGLRSNRHEVLREWMHIEVERETKKNAPTHTPTLFLFCV